MQPTTTTVQQQRQSVSARWCVNIYASFQYCKERETDSERRVKASTDDRLQKKKTDTKSFVDPIYLANVPQIDYFSGGHEVYDTPPLITDMQMPLSNQFSPAVFRTGTFGTSTEQIFQHVVDNAVVHRIIVWVKTRNTLFDLEIAW